MTEDFLADTPGGGRGRRKGKDELTNGRRFLSWQIRLWIGGGKRGEEKEGIEDFSLGK